MKYLLYSFSLLFCLILSISCTNPQQEQSTNAQTVNQSPTAPKATLKPGFIHTVFFWYKEGIDEEKKKAFEASMDRLGQVPSIQQYFHGPPAGTPREVVDNSYDYAFIVHFKNKEDQDAYQVDPLHLEFIELYKDVWERVQVYDTLLN